MPNKKTCRLINSSYARWNFSRGIWLTSPTVNFVKNLQQHPFLHNEGENNFHVFFRIMQIYFKTTLSFWKEKSETSKTWRSVRRPQVEWSCCNKCLIDWFYNRKLQKKYAASILFIELRDYSNFYPYIFNNKSQFVILLIIFSLLFRIFRFSAI